MLKTVIVGYNICLTQVRFEPFVKHLLKIAQLGMNCGRWTKPNLSACVDKLGFFPDSRGKGGGGSLQAWLLYNHACRLMSSIRSLQLM